MHPIFTKTFCAYAQVDAVGKLKDVSEGLQGIKHIKEKVIFVSPPPIIIV